MMDLKLLIASFLFPVFCLGSVYPRNVGDGNRKRPFLINSQFCWNQCDERGGYCLKFCGADGYCCRSGVDDCIAEFRKVAPTTHHACVRVPEVHGPGGGSVRTFEEDNPGKDQSPLDAALELNYAARRADTYSDNQSNQTLFEGDIVPSESMFQTMAQWKSEEETGIVKFDAITRGQWPNGIIPWTYQGNEYRQIGNQVNAAVKAFSTATNGCIRWQYRSRAQLRGVANYVVIFRGGGCFSSIGRQRRPQRLSIGRGCQYKGIVMHEMMHAMGFYHEQSRRDRDKYIYISWNDIRASTRYNFQKYRPGEASTLGARYDKQSIMHYGNRAFSTTGRMTIISRSNRNEKLGQRKGLSTIDLYQLKKYYKCRGSGGKGKKKGTGTGGGSRVVCNDVYKFCYLLKSYCSKPTKGNWLKRYCKKTCNACPKPKKKKKPCTNLKKYCSDWAKPAYNYCKKTYVGYMKKNCRKACNFC